MRSLADMFWIELRKAYRSRMMLWTAIASLLMPLGVGFLILLARNPDVSQKLGLVGAKANLVSYAGTDWPAYTGFLGQMIAAGGFMLAVFVVSWIFGREFADGTLKDMLAVPVPRWNILFGKFTLAAAWSAGLAVLISGASLAIGALLQLPGGSVATIQSGIVLMAATFCLVIGVMTPFALFASMGRGFLLPIAVAALALMLTNLSLVIARGEYFPWAIPMLYAQAKSPLPAASYWIVFVTGLTGLFATYLWWKYADQNR